MQHGEISSVGKPVSRLVLGVLDHTTPEPIEALLDEYFDLGGNALDTAWLYRDGEHERILGRYMEERGVREQTVVVSKGGHTPLCDPDNVARQLPQSLDRLRTDYIDLYLLHRDNEEIPVGELVDALAGHQAAGRIRSFGVSNWSLERVAEADAYADAHGLPRIAVLSNQLSLARMVEPTFPGCVSVSDPESRAQLETLQLPVLAFSSQARGFFARGRGGPFGRLRATRSGRVLTRHADLKLARRPWSEAWDRNELARAWYSPDNFRRMRRTRALARKRGIDPSGIALAYVLHQPFPTFAVIGPRNDTELRSAVAALDVELTRDDAAWLDLAA